MYATPSLLSSSMVHNETSYEPPAGPPPLLAPDEIRHLAFQGWLPVTLPHELLQTLDALSQAAGLFFDQSPEVKCRLYPASNGTENGFYQVECEKEYLTFRHHVHPDSVLEHHASEAWQSIGAFLHRMLCDLSRAGSYSLSAWPKLLDGALEMAADATRLQDTPTLMRLFRYYPTSGFAASHVDLGLLTLCIGSGQGLQVLDRTLTPPQFIDAEGAVVVVGDTLRSLMRNQVRAGAHRVVENPHGRSSIIFALRPCLSHDIDLASFGGCGTANANEVYVSVKGNKYNINATKDIREKQQQAQREKKSISDATRFSSV
ncbi:Hypothetical protein R9X50_00010500 [Acrodontium crateriforme]|uniref:Fe2OG dioxygenase domain-containing protein n=1 Tax=Acrodontium crateriforme TaxID=150365 RepID=A0AAQ3M2P8_9PEZI|nr:Hypothetical protein R9X50_00010500 [Acrodontium crateriforme]